MTKSEMLAQWKKTSALKSDFSKKLGERYPHLCYTDVKLLEKINSTLQSLTTELSKVKDGEPEAKAKKEEAKPEADTKIAEHEVKATTKANAKASSKGPTKA